MSIVRNLIPDDGSLWSIRANDISGNYGQKIDLSTVNAVQFLTGGTSRAIFNNSGLVLQSAGNTITTQQSSNLILDASNSFISLRTSGVERARITDANFTIYNSIYPQIPHGMTTGIQSPGGTYQQTSATYTNFFDNASLLRITGFLKQSSTTALLVTINGMFFQSSGPGGGLITIGANISGTDFDLASAATNTLNSFTSASFSNIIASGYATGSYTIQARWRVDHALSQWYSVNPNARWVMMVQEIFNP